MCVVTATHPTQTSKAPPACARSVTNHLVLHCRASTSKLEYHAEVRQLDTCNSKKKAGVIVGPALSRVWSFFFVGENVFRFFVFGYHVMRRDQVARGMRRD